MDLQQRASLVDAHRARWSTFFVWEGFVAALFLAEGLLAWAVATDRVWLALPAVLLVAHLMHSQLLAFHETAHGVLCPNQWVNDFVGSLIGRFHLNGLELFRAVHHTHHSYLGTERDEQLWPFVHPSTPRWQRKLAAACELSLGIVYDLVEFLRAFLRPGSSIRNHDTRRRITIELTVTALAWTIVLTAVAYGHAWKWLLWLYVIPAVLAGDMHSLRKYIEHMGMTGSTVEGLTRTIVPKSLPGRLLGFTLFNISYHSVHHYYPSMPEASLPQFISVTKQERPDEQTTYPSYWEAFRAMLPTLADPKVGPQWERANERAHPPITAPAAMRVPGRELA